MRLGWSQETEKATAGFLLGVLASGREEAAGLDFMEEVLSLCSVIGGNEPWVDLSGQSGSRLVKATGSIRLNVSCSPPPATRLRARGATPLLRCWPERL